MQDVFKPTRITRVPLAGAEIAGVLNLRGRIVTAIEMRSRLGLQAREEGKAPMAIGIESRGKSFGLLVDAVGEVLKLSDSELEPNPINLDRKLGGVSAGVYRLDGQLLSCSTSTGCSISAPKRQRREGSVDDECVGGERNQSGFAREVWSEDAMKTCLVVENSSVIRKVARRILEGLDFRSGKPRTARKPSKMQAAIAGRDPARLEHAENGRL